MTFIHTSSSLTFIAQIYQITFWSSFPLSHQPWRQVQISDTILITWLFVMQEVHLYTPSVFTAFEPPTRVLCMSSNFFSPLKGPSCPGRRPREMSLRTVMYWHKWRQTKPLWTWRLPEQATSPRSSCLLAPKTSLLERYRYNL